MMDQKRKEIEASYIADKDERNAYPGLEKRQV